MSPVWQTAIVLQGIVLFALVVIVLALVRQLGVLTVRLNPAAAFELDEGPAPGTRLPLRVLETLDGGEIAIGGDEQPATVLFFVKPGCGPCDTMVPSFRKVARDAASSDVRLALAVIADRVTSDTYTGQHSVNGLPVIPAQRLAREFSITSTPYALAVGSNGVVAKRGIVNALEHLEEVVEIARRGVSWRDDGPSGDRASDGAAAGRADDAFKDEPELAVTLGGLERSEEER